MNDRNKSYFVHESSYIDENVEIGSDKINNNGKLEEER